MAACGGRLYRKVVFAAAQGEGGGSAQLLSEKGACATSGQPPAASRLSYSLCLFVMGMPF